MYAKILNGKKLKISMKNSNGFSLAELSIVLIIIGLLGGGVTGGTSPKDGELTKNKPCTLTGGETVESGWRGKDTGSNYCNNCFCTNGMLGCTKMGCRIKQNK